MSSLARAMTAPLFGGAGDGDAAAAAELEQSFVPKQAQRPKHRVGVDIEDGCEVFGGRESLSGFRFPARDRASDLAGDLFVEVGGVGAVDLDTQHGAIHNSATVTGVHP